MIDVEERHLNVIKNILKKYPYTFFAFGSRVKGTARKFSDLDLCYKDNISDVVIGNIKEEMEVSDLPFKVDFISWDRCSDEFKKNIEKDMVKIVY